MTPEEIAEQERIDELDNQDDDEWDEQDYKAMYEAEKQRADKNEKYEKRFKKTAKELNEIKGSGSNNTDVQSLVQKTLSEEMYFMSNPVAKEFKTEIKALQQSNWLSTEDAYTLWLAKNKPELIGKQSSTWVDWVAKTMETQKSPKEMSYEELRATK